MGQSVKLDRRCVAGGGAVAGLSACGGGGGGTASSTASSSLASSSVTSSSLNSSTSASATSASSSQSSLALSSSSASSASSSPGTISAEQAASFLAQASLASSAVDIAQVQSLGYRGWLDVEMAKPPGTSLVEMLKAKGLDDIAYKNNVAGIDNVLWKRLLTGTDPLRLRVALALSEIVVVSSNLAGVRYRQFAMAYYWGILEANTFGHYRDLLEQVSKAPAMGAWLTYRGNRKASGDNLPDENYAREIMQLFSIGVYQLNLDGSLKLSNDKPIETYNQTDVSQLARVFTGWDLDPNQGTKDTPDASYHPMVQTAKYHESGTKVFLGTSIPANTDGETSLQLALDTLLAHPNMAPFISRQLIQRLVTSNPDPSYVARVAAVFNNNGVGVKGDLAAVVRAILLDSAARSSARLSDVSFGKLREPMLRFLQWARTFGYRDAKDTWAIGDTSDPATRLGQSPLRSASVFNFYRPGYVPLSKIIGERTVPEFQITTETSVAGYINYMQTAISKGVAGTQADYSQWLPLTSDTNALLTQLNLVLAANQLSTSRLANFKTALDSIDINGVNGVNGQSNRLYAAILLVMSCPEYLTQK